MNSLLILDHFLVQTPSPLRPVTVLTPQQVINPMVNTPPHRVLLIVPVEVVMLLMVETADTLILIPPDLLVVTHQLLMDLPQEVLVTITKSATATTVSKN